MIFAALRPRDAISHSGFQTYDLKLLNFVAIHQENLIHFIAVKEAKILLDIAILIS